MNPLIGAQFVICGICLSIGLLHLGIYSRIHKRRANLFFALMCFSMAAGALFEGIAYRAGAIDAYNSIYRLQVNAQALFWFFMVWFIVDFTGTARRWLAILVAAIYGLCFFVNSFSAYGILYSKIETLKTSVLPWGERIVYASGPSNPWRLVADAGWLLMIYLMIESWVRLARHGQRRQAVFFGVSLFICLGPAYLHGTLVDLGLVAPPFYISNGFIALILVISGYLVNAVVQASVLSSKVAADERRWRSLMENIHLLAMELDPQGRIGYVNHYFETVSGYTAAEAMGRPITEFVPQEERPDLLQQLQTARAGWIRPHSTRPLLTKDGKQRHISWFHVIEREPGDQISAILSIGEDVTELRQAQRELADEKAHMDVILASQNTGLALMDPELKVIWVNETTRNAFPWDDPVGKNVIRWPKTAANLAKAAAPWRLSATVAFTKRKDSIQSTIAGITSSPCRSKKRTGELCMYWKAAPTSPNAKRPKQPATTRCMSWNRSKTNSKKKISICAGNFKTRADSMKLSAKAIACCTY